MQYAPIPSPPLFHSSTHQPNPTQTQTQTQNFYFTNHPRFASLRAGARVSYESLLKTELEVALESYLRANETRLSTDPVLEPFYRRIGALSSASSVAVKRESGGGVGSGSGGVVVITSGDEVVKRSGRVRRQTRGRDEVEQM